VIDLVSGSFAARRNVDGETPVCSLKKREKLPGAEKPTSNATSVNEARFVTSRTIASSTLTALQNTNGVVFSWSRRWNVDPPRRQTAVEGVSRYLSGCVKPGTEKATRLATKYLKGCESPR
jgi:hypothetical protein